MFSSISWQLFFTAIFIVSVLYYSFIGMVYFPKEILTFLLGKKNKVQSAIAEASGTDDRQFAGIMGRSGDGQASDDQYFNRFRSSSNDAPAEDNTHIDTPQPSDISLIESVSNLMEGIKTLFRVIKDADGSKDDVTSLFPSLLAQYAPIADSKYRYSVNAYIHEICTEEYKYEIAMQEVNDMWLSSSKQ